MQREPRTVYESFSKVATRYLSESLFHGRMASASKVEILLNCEQCRSGHVIRADRIDPEQNRVMTAKGEVPYDYLIIATGPKLNFGAVPGLGPSGHTQSVCNVDHAEQAWGAYQSFLKDPGPIVIGAAQGASCFGPAYETAFIFDADLRKKKLRKKVPIYFVTPEPYIGHMGLAGVGKSRRLMEDEFAEHSIKPIHNTAIKEVQPGKMLLNIAP